MFASKSALGLWEFGGDLHLADNIYDSFCQYQNLIRQLMSERGDSRGYELLSANASVAAVNLLLRERIAPCLGIEHVEYKPSNKLKTLYELS